jgi:hypothetical protein
MSDGWLFHDLPPDGGAVNQYGFPLEDRRPIARESDPQTSHVAAAKQRTKIAGVRGVFVEVLGQLGRATANEVAVAAVSAGLARNAETVRKRANECVDLGFVRVVSTGPVVCTVTGQLATQFERVEG